MCPDRQFVNQGDGMLRRGISSQCDLQPVCADASDVSCRVRWRSEHGPVVPVKQGDLRDCERPVAEGAHHPVEGPRGRGGVAMLCVVRGGAADYASTVCSRWRMNHELEIVGDAAMRTTTTRLICYIGD